MTPLERLIERLRKVQQLHANPGTPGERAAAAEAMQRLQARIDEQAPPPPDEIEYKLSVPDRWDRRLLTTLLRRDGLRPYRYKRQRRTTIMVRASERQMNRLWAEYELLSQELTFYLNEVTERVLRECVHTDTSEPQLLGPGS